MSRELSSRTVILRRSRSKPPIGPRRRLMERTASGRASPAAWTRRDAMHSSVPLRWQYPTGANEMNKRISAADLADLLGPEPVKAPAERRHPFKEYNYTDLTNAPKKVYLCGDDDRPVLLAEALWQTMGLLKS